MAVIIDIDRDRCIQCGKCVRVCPVSIFVQAPESKGIEIQHVDSCLVCGHCVGVCPEDAVVHSAFPAETVHPVDAAQLPTPEQMMLLCKSRRSNRAFSARPIPEEYLTMILEAAHRAPTGSNMQEVKFVLITQPEKIKQVTAFTMGVFSGLLKKLNCPLLRPIVKRMIPELYKYVPAFERMQRDYYQNGEDVILRKATAVILIYTPQSARMGVLDANLAYQNGSLMAECLGVSQFYTGFVQNAVQQQKGKLEQLLGIDGVIHAGMALGIPSFRYPKYIDRKEIEVVRL